MRPTNKQIKAEIELLKGLRDKIPPRSSFGDDNLARIDAEIDVLEHNLTGAQIDRKYGDDETAEEYSEEPSAEKESADYARMWLDGDALDGAMSDNWRPLIGSKPIKL